MKKLLLLLLCVPLMFSCGESGWPEDKKKAFMENCLISDIHEEYSSRSNKISSLMTADYCSCALEKVQKKYPKEWILDSDLTMDNYLELILLEAEDCL